jgi:DNA invertase Pin-like site-specific DNA recombinase
MARLIGYVRVSRVGGREGDSFISPAVQRERIGAHAKAHGHDIVAVHEDLDEPGSRYERAGFQAALEQVEAGEANGIIVAALDRFARSVPDAAVALRRLDDAGGTLISVRDLLDTSTPVGRFARTMMLAIAELELERIREGWDVAKARAVGRGVHFASRGVVGYRRERGQRLEPDPETAPAIVVAFEARASGASYTELAALLDSQLGAGPDGSPRWTAQSVKRVLANRAYLGEARWGDHVRRDAHEPLVTESLFLAAQNGHRASPMHSPDDGALLHGLLRCAGCRHCLNRTVPRTRSDGTSYRDYRCRREHSSGTCPASGSVQAHVIEEYVVEQFFRALGPDGILAARVADDTQIEQARGEVEQAERERAVWLEEFSVADFGRDAFLEGLRAREGRLDAARAAHGALVSTAAAALPEAVTLTDMWPTLPLDDQRKILAAGVGAVFLRRGGRSLPLEKRVHICWCGEEPHDLPRRGVAEPLRPFEWPDADRGAAYNHS